MKKHAGQVRGATKAGKSSESSLVSSRDEIDAVTRTSAGTHLPGDARSATQQLLGAGFTAHPKPLLWKRRKPSAKSWGIDREAMQRH